MSQVIQAVAVIDLGNCQNLDSSCPVARFASRHLQGQTLISRMVRRLHESPLIERIAISGEYLPSSLLTSGIPGVTVLDMPHTHVIERLAAAADRTHSSWVVFLPGNRPFIDPVLIDRLLSEASRASECDYVGFFSPRGGWERMQQLGLAAEVCHADSLRRLRRNLDRLLPQDSNPSLSSWFQDAPGAYQMRFIPVPAPLDRNDLRFVLESERDWDLAQSLCDSIACDETQWQTLTELALSHELHAEKYTPSSTER